MSRRTYVLPALIPGLALVLACAGCKEKSIPPVDTPAADTPEVEKEAEQVCKAHPDWVSSPNPPEEVPGLGGVAFCDFYKFSWQWFLELMSPSDADSSVRNFQVAANYPLFDPSIDSCSAQPEAGAAVFVRTTKTNDPNSPTVIPKAIGQAGGGATIYDQGGNVVFYDVRFNRSLCEAKAEGDLPEGTTELKTAWRIIEAGDASRYVTMEAEIEGVGKTLLGMVGFHLVRSTKTHPEFVWATFEHKDNVPDCAGGSDAPSAGWSFTSSKCAECLQSKFTPDACPECGFNEAAPASALTGTASEICRVFPDGTADGVHKAEQNRNDINALNIELVGAEGILTQLGADDPMAVLQNYINVGALWQFEKRKPSSDTANQRGSMQLENAVMETTFQAESNCFSCHEYVPGKTATSHDGISHIFSRIHGSGD